MRNARKSQWVGNFVGIECLNVVLFGDNTNGVGITTVVDAYCLPRLVLSLSDFTKVSVKD
mgnify:CR=1 FL=1